MNSKGSSGQGLEKALGFFGFSGKEVSVYLTLIKDGEMPAGLVVKKAGLKRGITYNVLYRLEEAGLIRKFAKGKKTFFAPLSPYALLDLMKKKREDLQNQESSVKGILPALTSAYKLSMGKPTVRYFEGEEGIKQVFEDIYAPKSEPVLGCVDLEKSNESFPDYIVRTLIPKRIKNKVKAYSLVGNSAQSIKLKKNDKKQMRQTLLCDKKNYPFPAEIDVYEDKVAMLTFRQGEFIGLIIENSDIASSLKSVFSLAFNSSISKTKLH